ncbi:MAG: hypothetical protein AAFY98_04985 [Verrucomicrobiota bacterium]
MRYTPKKEPITVSSVCFIFSAIASLLTLILQMGLYFIAPGGILLELESMVVRHLSSYWLVMAVLVGTIATIWTVGFCFLMHTWWVLRRIKRYEISGMLLTPATVLAGALLFGLLASLIPALSITL